ncbi:hypothetical protein QOZ80_2BG0155930 [Eleusine coracana subsp. coracana]|nr:hypothetical protein QOZ80_2BG0155930 [Eleusine coracana subsp. coracana]
MAARSASIASFVLLLLLVAVPSSSNLHVKFDLRGSVYPHGEIYAIMKIGAPALEYNLHVDTGSVLTWVQCTVPRPTYCKGPCNTWHQILHQYYYNLIPAKVVKRTEPLCVEWLHGHRGTASEPGCNYKISYAGGGGGGGGGGGNLRMVISSTTNSHSGRAMTVTPSPSGVDTTRGEGGFLFIGEIPHYSVGISWIEIDTNGPSDHYSPTVQAALHFHGNLISKNLMKVVFDSGTTYTYFDKEPYQMTVNAVKHSLHPSLREVKDPHMQMDDLCWRGARGFRSVDEIKPLFKNLALVFTKADKSSTTLEIPPENYLIITGNGNVCFGIFQTPIPGTNLIGAVTMQDRIMIYDNEEEKIGWVHGPCRIESESEITSRL